MSESQSWRLKSSTFPQNFPSSLTLPYRGAIVQNQKEKHRVDQCMCTSVQSPFASLVSLPASTDSSTTLGYLAYFIYVFTHCTGNKTTKVILKSSKSME